MRSIRLIMSVVILSMLFASALLAQEALTETFTSEDGSLTFNYPSGWIVDYEGTQIIGGNSQAAIAAVLNREPAARDHVVFAFFNPLSAAELEVSADATAADALNALGIDDEESSISIEERTVGGVELAFATYESEDDQPNMAVARALDGGLFLAIVARTAPESVETYLPTLLNILASAVYTPPPPGGGAVLELPAGTIPDPAPGAGDVRWEVNMDGRQIYIQNLAVDTQGNIYVVIEPYPFTGSSGDDGLRGVLVFNTDGIYQRAFYNAETDLRLTAMTVGADGSIWFSKFGYGSGTRSQLIQLDAEGNLVSRFTAGIGFLGEGEFVVVSGSDGNLYSQVSDEAVRVFAPDGSFAREFDARGQLGAASLDGALYFVEYGETRAVHATDLEGNPLVSIPFGEGVNFIAAVAAGNGLFYLADSNRLLRQYDSGGTLTGSYELANLAGNMAVLPDGDVIVTYRNTLARVRVSGMAAASPTAAPVVSQPLGPAAPQPTATPRPTLAPTPIPTQAAAGASLRIEYGETVSGNLVRNSVDRWTFVGNTGDQVAISMTSPDFDTYLELLNPSGTRIAFNDDGGEGLNSLINGFSLPANGMYTIVARGYSTSASGAYELTLSLGTVTSSAAPAATAFPTTAPNATVAPRSSGRTVIESGTIEYGETINGRLGSAQAHHYSLRGNGGDVISISMTSPDFDTYLEIFSSDGTRIAFNDDGGEGLNSLINGFSLPVSGTYTIVAFGFRDTASGPYELRVVLGRITLPTAPPPPTSTPRPSTSMGMIEYGQTVQATLARGNRDEYTLRGNAGDVLTVSLTSAAFDTYLEIFSADGTRIAYNDDGGEGLNSLINGFSLPASGTYTIVARGFSATADGDYVLTLTLGSTTAPTPTPSTSGRAVIESGTIEYGEAVSGRLRENEAHHWTFQANEGDTVNISLTSPDFDTFLEVFSSDGVRGAFDDDGGEGLNSYIYGLTLPDNGIYTIVARGFSTTAAGAYDLFLSLVEERDDADLTYGDTIETVLVSNTRDLWTFAGSAGDEVTISMTSAAFDTLLELLDSEGTVITLNDDGGVGLNSLIEDFILPEDGEYIIVARGFNTTASGPYTLTLTSPNAPPPGRSESSTSGTIRQWASRAQATSQYGNPRWGAIQATGAPDTNRCGDLATAWASSTSRGRDSLTVYFDQAVVPTQINIYQTYTPGSIISVDLIQVSGPIVRVPNSADPGTPCPGIFTLNITMPNLLPVNGVIINLDQTIGGNWNEIDAVELVGRRP